MREDIGLHVTGVVAFAYKKAEGFEARRTRKNRIHRRLYITGSHEKALRTGKTFVRQGTIEAICMSIINKIAALDVSKNVVISYHKRGLYALL